MDNHNNQYFLYGGVFSILFSLSLLASILFIASKTNKAINYTQTDNMIVTVSLEQLPNLSATPVAKSDPQDNKSDDSEIDSLDDIFDSIDSEKIVYSKNSVVKDVPKVDNEFLKKIQIRKNIKHEKRETVKRNISKPISLQQSDFKSKDTREEQSGGEKNIYYAKVQNLLYQSWQQPSQNFQQSKVMIKITSSGKMSYQIKQVSGDAAFDLALKAHLEYLLDTIFPISPDGLSIIFETYFKSKEQ
jgi:hypothetical protein